MNNRNYRTININVASKCNTFLVSEAKRKNIPCDEVIRRILLEAAGKQSVPGKKLDVRKSK